MAVWDDSPNGDVIDVGIWLDAEPIGSLIGNELVGPIGEAIGVSI